MFYICLESFQRHEFASTTVAIADSSALFRLGVRNMAGHVKGIQIVGEASTSEDLVGLVQSFDPKVVIVDFLAGASTSTWCAK